MSSLTRPLSTRAIHLRITPRPSNLGESREILRLLSAFGEIEHFKSLRYDVLSAPNAALVIYKDEAAALECLKRSPVRFRMGRVSGRKEELEKKMDEGEGVGRAGAGAGAGETTVEEKEEVRRGPVGSPFGLGASTTSTQTQQARSMSTQQHQFAPSRPTQTDNRTTLSSPNPFPLPAQPFSPSSDESQRIFQITTHPSSRHFRDHVNVNHYHGPFAIDTKQFGQADLAKKVPTPGLSCMDWRAVEKPWHVIKLEKERESSGFKPRKRLGELWEEGRRQREEDEGFGVGVGKEKDEQGGTKKDEFGLFGKGWRG
ncbi:hypothetical protein LTR37_013487 [Vermiconidia calcicola]|uniref:Uncharacterized protein n=1 Tax=Vermiconidia calcicola TaxID=1690605 RepID=A0ACC3MXW7_9PEZI|nr:hypothetical protein LTR37_013487 [Vermiconidia calcicola]